MRSKRNTYILLGVVFVIWGIIIFKFVGALGDGERVAAQEEFQYSFNPMMETVVDSFDVQVHERDPFLGRLIRKTPPKTTIKKKPPPPPPVMWPDVVYKGMVSGSSGQNAIFLVWINGRSHLLSKGDVANEVKIVSGNATTLSVAYKKEKRSITLQQ